MRLLAILGVVQTACLLFLVFQRLDSRSDAAAEATEIPARNGTLAVPVSGEAQPLDEARLRRIIRDELAAQAHRTASQPTLATRPRNPLDDQLRRERVGRQLDYYKRLGRISPAQMQAMQDEIAQLEPAARKEMLGNLARSLNRGEIEGLL